MRWAIWMRVRKLAMECDRQERCSGSSSGSLLLLHGLRLSFEFLDDRSERLRIDAALTQRDAQTELIARQTRLQQLAHRVKN